MLTSGTDPGGGRQGTRFKGPLVPGVYVYSTATLVDPYGSTGGQGGGTSTAPMYSYWNRQDLGWYLINNTSSAGAVRHAVSGLDMVALSSAGLSQVSSDNALPLVWANGLITSSAITGALYIPQSTFAVSSSSGGSSGVTPTALGSGVAMIFDSLRNKISVFSTVANQWLSVTLTSS